MEVEAARRLIFIFTSDFYNYLCTHKKIKRARKEVFNSMIIVNVKEGESLDRALKRFKKKFEKTGVLRELRSRQAYEKKSVARRTQLKKAIYKQQMNQEKV